MGKYGEEGDKLLFRILNSGDFLAEVPDEARKQTSTLLPYITEKALRYDLTVPMARWVAQHAGELVFPFKRYQIQPVWRADRPQRGRFREFYQCDVDIVGAEGILPLLEMITLAREGLRILGIKGAVFHLNHRFLLEEAARQTSWRGSFSAFCGHIDKADKIGWEAVQNTFKAQQMMLPPWLHPEENFSERIQRELSQLEIPAAEIEALRKEIEKSDEVLVVRWDPTLARGLEYYTGYVYEVRLPGSGVGSIAAGGAYGDLIADFGGPDLPAMGLSFGIERILSLLPEPQERSPQPVLVAWIDASPTYVQKVVDTLHAQGIPAFAYPSPRKIGRQLEYAQRRGFRWVAVVGQQEETQQQVQLKDLFQHTQQTYALSEVASVCSG